MIRRILEAVDEDLGNTPDQQLRDLLFKLDAQLTGKQVGDVQVARGASASVPTVEDFAEGDYYYMSDGGYSRLFWYPVADPEGEVQLASESTKKVRDRWNDPDVVETREFFSRDFRGWLEELL